MRSQPQRRIPLLALSVFALGTSGCLIGSNKKTDEAGRLVDQNLLAQIKPGTEASKVIDLLGEPKERRTLPGGSQMWSWYYRKSTERSDYVFLIFGGQDKSTFTQQTFVEVANDKVVRIWQE